MTFPRKQLILYHQAQPDNKRCAWANYNEAGGLLYITDYYGELLECRNGSTLLIDQELWVIQMEEILSD